MTRLCVYIFTVRLRSIWRLPERGRSREHASTHRKRWPGCNGGEKEGHPGSLQLLLPRFDPLLVSAVDLLERSSFVSVGILTAVLLRLQSLLLQFGFGHGSTEATIKD